MLRKLRKVLSSNKSQPKVGVEDVEVIEGEVVEERNYAAMLKEDLHKEASNMGIEFDAKAAKAFITASLKDGVKLATKEEKIVEDPVSHGKTTDISRRGRSRL